MDIKKSFGLLLCRRNPKTRKLEVIIVHKRFTYAYCDFVCGNYDESKIDSVQQLLDEMSPEELVDLYSLNFRIMWYKIWLQPESEELFAKKFKKFYRNFGNESIKQTRFREMIEKTKTRHGDPLWEFPKGRKRENESEISCAIREFCEETRIDRRDFTVKADIFRSVMFEQDNHKYFYKFFLAVANQKLSTEEVIKSLPPITSEVNDIAWASMERVKLIDIYHRLEKVIAPIFNYLSKKRGEKCTTERIQKNIRDFYQYIERSDEKCHIECSDEK
jgi:8-oxo-dGTP pyrophosphatase MutT (NUDIX family)